MSDPAATGAGGPARGIDAVTIGEAYSHHKTITDADITLYAGLVGDFHRIHLDDEYAKQTIYGRRLAHGALMVGLMSAAGTLLWSRVEERVPQPNVSRGYDRVRFIKPVCVGDTITATATVMSKREERNQVLVEHRCVNQRGELVAIATGIAQFV